MPDSQASAQEAPPAPFSPLAPLRHKSYRTMWTAQLFSNFGSLVQNVGAAWLMTELTNSPDWVAAVQAAISLPIVLFSRLAGGVHIPPHHGLLNTRLICHLPLVVTPPAHVELKIIETDPGLRGDTATGGQKPAKLETAQARAQHDPLAPLKALSDEEKIALFS